MWSTFPGELELQGVQAILQISVTEVQHEKLGEGHGHVSGWKYPGTQVKSIYQGTQVQAYPGTWESVCDDFLLS